MGLLSMLADGSYQALALYSNLELSDLRGVRGAFGLGLRCV